MDTQYAYCTTISCVTQTTAWTKNDTGTLDKHSQLLQHTVNSDFHSKILQRSLKINESYNKYDYSLRIVQTYI